MIGRLWAFAERRALAFETARRGRRAAAREPRSARTFAALSEAEARLGEAEIVSFDLFDTLLHREGLAPEAILRKAAGAARLFGGRAAGEAAFAARFAFQRAVAARMRADGLGDEPELGYLLESAFAAAGVPERAALARRLVAFETAAEAAGLRADPETAALLDALRARGLRLVAVTDMHLPRSAIERLIAGAGLGGRFERVFVSAEAGWTKKGGRLFPTVAAALGAAPSAILHVGDRIEADVAPAEAAGLKALRRLDPARFAAREAARLAEAWVPAPATRRARLAAALGLGGDGPMASAEEIADRLFGPALGLFALAALGRARRMGARRLLHLTRDGTLAGEIAAEAAARHDWLAPEGLAFGPLAVSRARGALLGLRAPADLAELVHLLPYLTGRAASAASLRAAFGLDWAADEETEAASGPAFVARLAEPARAAGLLAALTPARAALEAHLDAAGLFGEGPTLLLDIGYSGTFAAQLSAFFHAEPGRARRVEQMFLMTAGSFDANLRRLHPAVTMRPGLALDHRRRADRAAGRSFAWAEPFLVDPARGRLVGHDPDGAPRFAESPLGAAAQAARATLRERLRARALEFLAAFPGAPGDVEEIGALLRRRMARFAARPSGGEVRALRGLAHQTGIADLAAQDPTRPVNPLRLLGELDRLKAEDRWIGGSLRRSGLGLVNRVLAGRAEPDHRADPRAPLPFED